MLNCNEHLVPTSICVTSVVSMILDTTNHKNVRRRRYIQQLYTEFHTSPWMSFYDFKRKFKICSVRLTFRKVSAGCKSCTYVRQCGHSRTPSVFPGSINSYRFPPNHFDSISPILHQITITSFHNLFNNYSLFILQFNDT